MKKTICFALAAIILVSLFSVSVSAADNSKSGLNAVADFFNKIFSPLITGKAVVQANEEFCNIGCPALSTGGGCVYGKDGRNDTDSGCTAGNLFADDSIIGKDICEIGTMKDALTHTDSCNSIFQVKEWWLKCNKGTFGGHIWAGTSGNIDCPTNAVCSDGACRTASSNVGKIAYAGIGENYKFDMVSDGYLWRRCNAFSRKEPTDISAISEMSVNTNNIINDHGYICYKHVAGFSTIAECCGNEDCYSSPPQVVKKTSEKITNADGTNYVCMADNMWCNKAQITETNCADGIDNDCDGLVDCADSDCGCVISVPVVVQPSPPTQASSPVTTQPANVSTKSCTDSDGGLNYYVKGTVVLSYPDRQEVYEDVCTHDLDRGIWYLHEEYCNNGIEDTDTHVCPNGCSNGACIQAEETQTYSFKAGEHMQEETSGKTIMVMAVYESSVSISVDGVEKIVSKGKNATINGIRIKVDDIYYNYESPTISDAIIEILEVSGGGAAGGLGSYPSPFVANGAADVTIIYGADAPAADIETAGYFASDLATYLASQTRGQGGPIVYASIYSDIIESNVNVGNLAGALTDAKIDSLLDTGIVWNDGTGPKDYDVHEEIVLNDGGKLKIQTSGFDNPVMTVGEDDIIYKYVFDEVINTNAITPNNRITLNFLGQDMEITAINLANSRITVNVDNILRTYTDGDPYIGEDEDDPVWEWYITNTSANRLIIGVSYSDDAEKLSADDNPITMGGYYALPNDFARVKFVDWNGVYASAGVLVKSSTVGGGETASVVALGDVVMTDNEVITSYPNTNLIVIGGPNVNKIAAKILGTNYPTYCPSAEWQAAMDFNDEGKALIKKTANPYDATKIAVTIAGCTPQDTQIAAKKLMDDTAYFAGQTSIVFSTIGAGEVPAPSEVECQSGCMYSGSCISMGVRIKGQYCDIDKILKTQNAQNAVCENSYECLSGVCVAGMCTSGVAACNGCDLEGRCVMTGTRRQGKFCDLSGVMITQKEDKAACDENYECLANNCENGKCVAVYGILQNIWCHLKCFINEPTDAKMRQLCIDDCLGVATTTTTTPAA